jgi:curved DNA-binding protein
LEFRDYYKILGVDKTSSQDDIKKAYRILAKRYHPDANPNSKISEDKFKQINEAYEVLGDVEKRIKYNDLTDQANCRDGSDFDPSQAGFRKYRYNQREGTSEDFSDFFNAFFGGSSNGINDLFGERTTGNTRNRAYAQDGGDIEARITITPEEGFHGHKKRVILGDGISERTITFKIPAGIKQGEKIKLSGQGEPGSNGGKSGDLYIEVGFSEGGKVKISGLDLEMTLDLLPWDAALGSETTVNIIDDRILLKTPPGIQTGGKIRLAGKGYKDRNGNRGDLYIRVRIVNPRTLTKGMKDLFTEMKQQIK